MTRGADGGTNVNRTESPSGARVLLYCHDTFGLGHLRRTLTLAQYLRQRWDGAAQLIVTGSPLAQNFLLPEDADYVKLPSVVKTGSERYRARSLPMSLADVLKLRADIVLSAARHMKPDVFIVDNVPAGLRGELLPTLRYLKESSPGTRLVLGLRDIVDDAAHVRRAWIRDGAYGLLEDVYDLIVVYGDQEVYDVVCEYGFSERAAAKTRFVGYLERGQPNGNGPVRADLGVDSRPLVLVTAGGGGDGYSLFRAALDTVRSSPAAARFEWLLVGGPLLPATHRESLVALSAESASVRFLPSAQDLLSYIAAADVVVSMGGYNSLCEILSLARPAVIVPRVAPRREQLIRASTMSERGLVRMVHPDALTPRRLVDEVVELVGHSVPTDRLPRFEGLPGAAAELEALLRPALRTPVEAAASHDG